MKRKYGLVLMALLLSVFAAGAGSAVSGIVLGRDITAVAAAEAHYTVTPIYRQQAIAIASGLLPSGAAEKAIIETRLSYIDGMAWSGEHAGYVWSVTLTGVTVTREDLGWPDELGTSATTSHGLLDKFEIDVSAVTGNVLYRYAVAPGMPLYGDVVIKYQGDQPLPSYFWVIVAAGIIFAAALVYLALRMRGANRGGS